MSFHMFAIIYFFFTLVWQLLWQPFGVMRAFCYFGSQINCSIKQNNNAKLLLLPQLLWGRRTEARLPNYTIEPSIHHHTLSYHSPVVLVVTVVSHLGTDQAILCLASEVWWDWHLQGGICHVFNNFLK